MGTYATIEENSTYTNIILLRGVASALVVYRHLFAHAGELFFGKEFFPVAITREYLTYPAGIIQDFGWFGVVLFFLISGFLITHVACQESQLGFAVRRIFRIYPPLIVAIFFVILVDWMGGKDLLGFKEYLISFTLFNYMISPQFIVLGVAWTLIIEVLFYVLVFCVFPILKQKPLISILIELVIVSLVLMTCKMFGPGYFLFSVSFSYIPYLIAGQIIYLIHARKINLTGFWFLSLFSFVLMVVQLKIINTKFYSVDNSYLVSFLYAYFLFLITLLLRSYISPSKLSVFASNTSYSLYLYHAVIGSFLLEKLSVFSKNEFLIIPVVGVCYLFAYLSYYFVELPSIRLGRLLADRLEGWKIYRLKTPLS